MRAQDVMDETWDKVCRLEALLWHIEGLSSTDDPEQQGRQAWLIAMAYDEVSRLKKFVGSIALTSHRRHLGAFRVADFCSF